MAGVRSELCELPLVAKYGGDRVELLLELGAFLRRDPHLCDRSLYALQYFELAPTLDAILEHERVDAGGEEAHVRVGASALRVDK